MLERQDPPVANIVSVCHIQSSTASWHQFNKKQMGPKQDWVQEPQQCNSLVNAPFATNETTTHHHDVLFHDATIDIFVYRVLATQI